MENEMNLEIKEFKKYSKNIDKFLQNILKKFNWNEKELKNDLEKQNEQENKENLQKEMNPIFFYERENHFPIFPQNKLKEILKELILQSTNLQELSLENILNSNTNNQESNSRFMRIQQNFQIHQKIINEMKLNNFPDNFFTDFEINRLFQFLSEIKNGFEIESIFSSILGKENSQKFALNIWKILLIERIENEPKYFNYIFNSFQNKTIFYQKLTEESKELFIKNLSKKSIQKNTFEINNPKEFRNFKKRNLPNQNRKIRSKRKYKGKNRSKTMTEKFREIIEFEMEKLEEKMK
ncbi:hypothetical protein M0811_04756 [Anaeramoeba ignava]|uniref:Uncharacterized protein n=1 Tax=Anaeramoeba ignava TaxID=1746090 RepID=A0A9Q0RF26_ANAIG|nr:hypothetical protein M0811_04756 [Anaeramoeba ignava]